MNYSHTFWDDAHAQVLLDGEPTGYIVACNKYGKWNTYKWSSETKLFMEHQLDYSNLAETYIKETFL